MPLLPFGLNVTNGTVDGPLVGTAVAKLVGIRLPVVDAVATVPVVAIAVSAHRHAIDECLMRTTTGSVVDS